MLLNFLNKFFLIELIQLFNKHFFIEFHFIKLINQIFSVSSGIILNISPLRP